VLYARACRSAARYRLLPDLRRWLMVRVPLGPGSEGQRQLCLRKLAFVLIIGLVLSRPGLCRMSGPESVRTYRRSPAHASDLVQSGRATSLDLGFSTLLAKASLLSSTLSGCIARRRDTFGHGDMSVGYDVIFGWSW
jgi:hypothetical protein